MYIYVTYSILYSNTVVPDDVAFMTFITRTLLVLLLLVPRRLRECRQHNLQLGSSCGKTERFFFTHEIARTHAISVVLGDGK